MWRFDHGSSGRCLVVCVLAGALLVAPQAGAQRGGDSLEVRGVVQMISGIPIMGARVRVLEPGVAPAAGSVLSTADDGAFRLIGLARGTHVLQIRRIGFQAETVSVEVPALEGGRMIVPLTPLAVALAPVIVRASGASVATPFREFQGRRSRGFGTFITRQEIERRNPYRTSDLFRFVANMEIEQSGGRPVVRMRGRHCDPLVWLDRVPLVGGFPDIDAMPPKSIEGVEIYSGVATVPPDLIGPRDAGGCGVIVIWTRHGDVQGPSSAAAVDFTDAWEQARIFTADQVDSMAAPLDGAPLVFEYPDSLLGAKKQGEVLAEFVVDTLGQVKDQLINIVASSEQRGSDAVRRRLLAIHFSPAVRKGRLVEQLVYLPIQFIPTIEPPPSSRDHAGTAPPAPASERPHPR